MNPSFKQSVARTRISRLSAAVTAVLVASLGVGLGQASAVVQRPLIDSFGPDGTSGTGGFGYEDVLDFDQAKNRLYVFPAAMGFDKIFAFDMPAPGIHTSSGAPFPFTAGVAGRIAVDNSDTATAGRFYGLNRTHFNQADGNSLYGWDPTGNPLPAPFPLNAGLPGVFAQAAVDSNGNIAVANESSAAAQEGRGILRYTSAGNPMVPIDTQQYWTGGAESLAFDSQDNLYVVPACGKVWKFTAVSKYTKATLFFEGPKTVGCPEELVASGNDHVFVSTAKAIYEYDQNGALLYEVGVGTYGIGAGSTQFSGATVNSGTNEVYALNVIGGQIKVFGPPVILPDLTTSSPKEITNTSATLSGHVDLAGGPMVTDCFFQFDQELGQEDLAETVPCTPSVSPGDPLESATDVSADIAGLTPELLYKYRLVVKTAGGTIAKGGTFYTINPPIVSAESTVEATSDRANVSASINGRGLHTTFHVEYGTEDCTVSACESTTEAPMVQDVCYFVGACEFNDYFTKDHTVSEDLAGLTPGTLYHVRFVATNKQAGVGYGPENTFHTFLLDPAGSDPCPNAQQRKLTGAAKLAHCRGYELVSAADAGGYDVASNIVNGQTPLPAYPGAKDRFLYTTSDGKLPGVAGNPVNFGTDPYLAERRADGWQTSYAGLPATAPSTNPFASTLSGADAGLSAFAFGEPDVCDPCFSDGSSGVPLRLPNGELIQGMQGSIDVSDPEAAGDIEKPLSADANHFIFGSEQQFEPQGNDGAPTIYDRNLQTDTTQVASTMPDGQTISGDVAELDISADGGRILVGRHVRTDVEGNDYYDLYMHIGTDPDSVLVADTPNGVLYAGMSDDGSEVYFTTADPLADDADSSPDLFGAEVGAASATVSRISTGTGGTGNTDACTPPEDWNVAEGGPNCGVLAFAGGAGVASGDGTVYFISPERLDGSENGIQDQPNVYAAEPGSEPHYVALLDNALIKPSPQPPKRQVVGSFGPFAAGLGLAVDQSNGDIYVDEYIAKIVTRFDSSGAPKNFTAGTGAGTNRITIPGFGAMGGIGQNAVGVDNAAGSPFNGVFYVRGDVSATKIFIFANSGEKLGELTGFSNACGLAIDQTNGDVYVGDRNYGGVRRFHPNSAATPVSNANYTETSIKTEGLAPCQVAVDPAGYVYASQNEGPVRQYSTAAFAASPPELAGVEFASASRMVAVDPTNGEVYVGESEKITVFKADGTQFGTAGVGELENSTAVAVNGSNHHVFAISGESIPDNKLLEFGYEPIPYKQIDHPAPLHAVKAADTHNGEDIQLTPDGDRAIFTSKLQLTDIPSDNHSQVYRYDATSDELACTSCMPSGVTATADAFLAPVGRNLSDDGRVFFTSPEQLTLRDTNHRTDAYEWDEGAVNLISTGTGIVNAALASVDVSGKNAYFFTRESIAPQDDNGSTMKVYDAREGGGFDFLPAGVPCQAADECRGAGTEVPPPPNIGTYKGVGGNAGTQKPKGCRRGFAKRHGRCVKRKPRGHHSRARHRHHTGSTRNG